MKRKFSRSLGEIKEIVSFTSECFKAQNIHESMRHKVDFCLEELFVNMVTYNTETDARILIEILPHERGVEVSLTDYDVDRFDPRSQAPVNIDAPLEQRTPGGLGLFLVVKMVDAIHYEYHDRTSKIAFLAGRK